VKERNLAAARQKWVQLEASLSGAEIRAAA
jgi:hypothetical protein